MPAPPATATPALPRRRLLQAGAAAIENALLACVAEGLQGCWMTGPVRFAEDRLEVSGAAFAAGEAPSVPIIEIREEPA